MAGEYLFMDRQIGEIHAGELGEEQIGKFVEKRNEFLVRNRDLQESLYKGKDSESMTAVKGSYAELNDFMNRVIPADNEEYRTQSAAIEEIYQRLIENCEEYIKSHKHPITSEGKKRKAMVSAILSSARVEKGSVAQAALDLSAKVQEGMIWGNLFGQMEEHVELCTGVYGGFEKKFPQEEEAGSGERSLELAKVISGATVLKETEVEGELTLDMTKVWLQNNMSPELKKEYVAFRAFITGILVHDYKVIRAHRRNYSSYCGMNADERGLRQFAQLQIVKSENYCYYKALRDIAVYFGEDPLKAGIEGEEVISQIEDNVGYFNLLDTESVRRDLRIVSYYRTVNARSLLEGFIDSEKLDSMLGENVEKRQTDAIPFDMVRPAPEKAGTEKLDDNFSALDFARKTNRLEPVFREDVVKNEEGESVEEKWENVRNRLKTKHGTNEFNHNLVTPDGSYELKGLNSNRVFTLLAGVAGGDMTPADIEVLYDKLLSRAHIGTGEGKLSREEADSQFSEGIDQLTDIYLAHLRRMEATYGRLILQMHPEDICRQFGDEFYDHIGVVQDTAQITRYLLEYADTNSSRVREFIMLSDYFMEIYNRSMAYFQTFLAFVGSEDGAVRRNGSDITPDVTYEFVAGQEAVINLQNIQRFFSIKGPQMDAALKRKYNQNLKKRFHKKGGVWDYKAFGEFRGLENPNRLKG